MPQIGIFWFYGNVVIGRAIELGAGEEGLSGIIDSPDTHTDLWDNSRTLLQAFPKLRNEEYFSIPRGRVLWEVESASAKILMDSNLFEAGIKAKILKFFDLQNTEVRWGHDIHYSTNQKELSKLFDDEWP